MHVCREAGGGGLAALALVLGIHWESRTHVGQGQRGHFKAPSLWSFVMVALAMQQAIFTCAM